MTSFYIPWFIRTYNIQITAMDYQLIGFTHYVKHTFITIYINPFEAEVYFEKNKIKLFSKIVHNFSILTHFHIAHETKNTMIIADLTYVTV